MAAPPRLLVYFCLLYRIVAETKWICRLHEGWRLPKPRLADCGACQSPESVCGLVGRNGTRERRSRGE